MKKNPQILVSALIVICTAFLFVVLNYAVSFGIMDGCGQDVSDETAENPVFKLFFKISSDTGYHPEPTSFNFYFSLLIGAAIGLWFSRRVIRAKSVL